MGMNALYFDKHGGPEVLKYGELPIPDDKEGHCLIRVDACALNRLDSWVLQGWPNLKLDFPHIGGSDIAGTVVSGNTKWIEGERIVVDPGINLKQDRFTDSGEDSLSPNYRIIGEHIPGGLAEYVSVPIENLRKAPLGFTTEESAAPLLVGLTAYRMLVHRAKLQKGERVLIIGSGGGVNSMAIQMSNYLGGIVHVVCGGVKKSKNAMNLGARYTIDYLSEPDWDKHLKIQNEGGGYDVIIDNVGAKTWSKSLKLASQGGRIVTVGNTTGPIAETDIRYIFVKQLSILGSTMGSHDDFDKVLELLNKKAIRPVIDSIISLSDGKNAYERMNSGKHFGKIVIKP